MTRYLHITAIALAGATASGCSTLSANEYTDLPTPPAVADEFALCPITEAAPVTVIAAVGSELVQTTFTTTQQPASNPQGDAAKLHQEMTDAIYTRPACGPYDVRLTYKLDGTDDPAKRVVLVLKRPARWDVQTPRVKLSRLDLSGNF